MKPCLAALVVVLCLLHGTVSPAQTQRALLIAINTYEPEGTKAVHPHGCAYGRCNDEYFPNLDGSVNDAQSMADVLTSPKFHFPPGNVVLIANPAPPHPRPGVVLPADAQTTRTGILAAMQKYLVDVPKRGDIVVFYYAGHGSLRVNSKGTKLTVQVGDTLVPADSTIVPSDAYQGGFDVRDREMTKIFNAALDKGIHLTVILDSCHSGAISRGIDLKYRKRSLDFDPRDVAEAPDLLPNGQPRPAPTQRADNPALIFSAVQQDQTANELPALSPKIESHGAFTGALVEALQAMPANTPASALFQRVEAVLGSTNVPDQDPDLDTTPTRRRQPLFGGAPADPGKVLAAALETVDGSVWLDIGRVSGIGVGSEFTASTPDSSGQKAQLRVTSLEGLARSSAQLVSPADASVAPGTIFELTKWVPAESAPLLVWNWPTLSQAEVLAAAAQVKAAAVATVDDPAVQSWTHILVWDGTQWSLQQAGAPSAVSLGAPLKAGTLKQYLPAGAKLWVNLPPPSELHTQMAAANQSSAVQPAPGLGSAHYVLIGSLTSAGPVYAWYHTSELAAGPPSPAAAGTRSPGCSATSSYPVRSDWVSPNDATAGSQLAGSAARLAKVHGWLQLADSPAGASTADYYSLILVPNVGATTPLSADQPAHGGDSLRMALQSNAPVTQARWVYVLDISCEGKGQVIYPFGNAENRFPNDSDTGNQFLLPGGPRLDIGEPFGVDTLIMLTTQQPLADPGALDFDGVVSRGTPNSPLEQLLNQTSAGMRGDPGPLPTNWSIGTVTLHSLPKANTP